MSQSVLRKILPVSLLLGLSLLLGFEKEEELFQIVKMQGGVYGAIAKPQFQLNCNAAIIINEDDVLVVDSDLRTYCRADHPIAGGIRPTGRGQGFAG